ncbi:MAG: ATP-grasp domain-containing protein [Gemmataceae bacterium]
MKIGITFNLRNDAPLPVGAPDDFFEEFDEPLTVAAIAEALRGLGHTIVELGDGKELLKKLLTDPPEFVFNFAEGQGVGRSREARVPGVLEMLGIPYTGSDPATLGACLDKDWTRRLVESVGVHCPSAVTISFGKTTDDVEEQLAAVLEEANLDVPLIAKPACEGSSKGIRSKCLVEKAEEFAPVVLELWNAYKQPILVEEFIAGDEITVGILGNDSPEILGIMRVVPKQPTERFVYGLDVKRDYKRLVEYECPARLSTEDYEAVEEAALDAYDVLGCRDVARLDFRLREGTPYFLEANPLPGLNPQSSDLVLMAGLVGVSHAQLVGRILQAAMERHS